MGGKGDSRCEVIWLNYEEDGKKISHNKFRIANRYVDVMGGVRAARRYLDRIIALLDLPRVQSPHSGKNRRIIAILSAEGLLVTGVIMAEISRNARGASGFSGAEGLS